MHSGWLYTHGAGIKTMKARTKLEVSQCRLQGWGGSLNSVRALGTKGAEKSRYQG